MSDGSGSAVNHLHSSASNEHGTPDDLIGGAWATLGRIDLDPASDEHFNALVGAERILTAETNGLTSPWWPTGGPGTVFLNPPGGLVDADGRALIKATGRRKACAETGACGLPPGKDHKHHGVTSSAKLWWAKLAVEFARGRVEAAIFVGFTLELLQSAQGALPRGLDAILGKDLDGTAYERAPSAPHQHALCLPRERLDFLTLHEDGRLRPGKDNTHASFVAYLGRYPERFRLNFSKIGGVVIPVDDAL